MKGSLALQRGVLWVGWHEKTAHVAAFDLDGRALARGFSFRDERLGRSTVSGLALDADHQLWIADEPASRVRRYSLFGRELGGLGLALDAPLEEHPPGDAGAASDDRPGRVRRPVALSARGDSDGLELLVACGGDRRHALQLFTGEGVLLVTLRPLGDPHGRYRGISGLDRSGRLLGVAERAADRVQVFRDLDFHFAFRPAGAGFAPTDLAFLEDGRLLVAGAGPGAGVILCDASGVRVRRIAPAGTEEGCVDEPLAVVVERGASERNTRVAILDRSAERVQVFNLEGRCYGAFAPCAPVAECRASGVRFD